MKRNIVLIGFMGTGKTSVGKQLAAKLKRPLVDIDHFIEQKEKAKIRDIFEARGEAHFRALEKEAVAVAARGQGQVITTGGGVVLDAENVRMLKETGILVALEASPETIYKRVKDSRHRPLLKGDDLMASIESLYHIRKPLYESAELRFQTDGRTASEVAAVIDEALKGRME